MKTQYDGTCKGPDKHAWKVGDEVFYDKTTKAICIDSSCFSKLRDAFQTGGNTAKPPTPAATLECKLANLKAFIDMVKASDIDNECWPACAGVWNATR